MCATPHRLRWERRRRGVEGCLHDVSGEIRQVASDDVAGFPVRWEIHWSNHDPPNLTAQCKQRGKFCQGKITAKAQNIRYSVLKLSIPSGGVPICPKMGKTILPLKT